MSNADSSGLGKLMPGFEFLQTLARQAAGGLSQTVGQVAPQLPNLGHWIAPTYDVKELEKRIEELRAVHFWLDQNTRTVAATIQALEVQKMTLNTLQNMNVSLSDVAESLKIKSPLSVWPGATVPDSPRPSSTATPSAPVARAFAGLEIPPRTGMPQPTMAATPPVAPTPVAASVSAAEPSAPSVEGADGGAAPAAGAVDPMQWWGALTQQFQTLATSALKEVNAQAVLDPSHNPVAAMARDALKSASDLGADMALKVAEAAASVGKAPHQAEAAAPAASASSAAATKPKARAAAKSPVKPAAKVAAKPLAKTARAVAKPVVTSSAKAVKKPAAKASTKR